MRISRSAGFRLAGSQRRPRGTGRLRLPAKLLLILAMSPSFAFAQIALSPKPACPPGCRVVEEIVMKEQVRFCCEVVPDMKKKWVYDWVEDAFCIPHTPLHKHGCDKEPHCRSCTRKLLVKKQVEECVGKKCEVKKTVETVPCKVYRIVPCGDGELAGSMPTNTTLAQQRPRILPYFVLERMPIKTP
jgi:hypothetical protein